MAIQILQSTGQQRGLILDPRTKLVLLLTVSIFVFGGLAGHKMSFMVPLLCVFTFVLIFLSGKVKMALFYLTLYLVATVIALFAVPQLTGFPHFILLACAGIAGRLLPGIAMGYYVISTTTVSEFTASMQKLHVSDKVTIPLSVMFRFFPTIGEEFASINAAMRMRGISFAGGNIGKMVEYRLVPLMACSAKIGEELSASALTRGLGSGIARTNICRIGFRVQDIIIVTLCATSFAAAVLVYLGVL